MSVIDFYLHLANLVELQPWATEYLVRSSGQDTDYLGRLMTSPKLLVEMLSQNGVDYAVVITGISPPTTGVISDEAVAEFCQGQKALIPFANINPSLVANPAGELERYVTEMGFKGLKLYPTYRSFYPNDSSIYPLYAKALELGIPLMIHTGSSVFAGVRLKHGDPLWIDDVAVDLPELTVIQVHGGRGMWYGRPFFLAGTHHHVHMEIAGLPPHKLIEYFPELERNAEKVICGSDGPGLRGIRDEYCGHQVVAAQRRDQGQDPRWKRGSIARRRLARIGARGRSLRRAADPWPQKGPGSNLVS